MFETKGKIVRGGSASKIFFRKIMINFSVTTVFVKQPNPIYCSWAFISGLNIKKLNTYA